MKVYRTMRLVVLVCQLGLILRIQAQIPDACLVSDTNRPPENSDIAVVCGTEFMDLSIYLCPVYQALYNEFQMVLNNQVDTLECYGTADWTADPPLLNFRVPIQESPISSCHNNFKIITRVGTGVFGDLQFASISGTVTSVDLSTGVITFRSDVLYKFSCLYPMQYIMNNTKLAVSGLNLVIRDNNGSFISTLSMELYKDELYSISLTMPERGLKQRTRIYVAVKATDLTDRFNVLLDRCYASTHPYPTLTTSYDLFVGCDRDEHTEVDLNGRSQKAHFSFEAFRFVEHKERMVSTFYLHCITRLCEVSSCSALMPDCGSFLRRWRREAPYVSNSTTITSRVIFVGGPSGGGPSGGGPSGGGPSGGGTGDPSDGVGMTSGWMGGGGSNSGGTTSGGTTSGGWIGGGRTTDLPSSNQNEDAHKQNLHTDSFLKGSSSLSCSSWSVVAATVCNFILTICISV